MFSSSRSKADFTKTQAFWDMQFQKLRSFILSYGHCKIPETYVSIDPHLVSWMKDQRKEYYLKQSKQPSRLTALREAMLDAVGFDWQIEKTTQIALAFEPPVSKDSSTVEVVPVTEPETEPEVEVEVEPKGPPASVLWSRGMFDHKWEAKYQLLVEFKKQHGHCRVKEAGEWESLCHWVRKQRNEYRKFREGYSCTMTETRVERMERLGFIWEGRVANWEDSMVELRKFKTSHGHCRVPSNYPGQLYNWIKTQRRQIAKLYNNESSPLTKERFKDLHEVGFLTEERQNRECRNWNDLIYELRLFEAEHGHFNVPYQYPPNPDLYRWVHDIIHQLKLRAQNEDSTLTEKRIKDLRELGFGSHRDLQNIGGFHLLHSKSSTTDSREESPADLLVASKESIQAKEKKSKTEAQQWEAFYRELVDFKNRHGHCSVPRENKKLFRWLGKQRIYFRNRKEGKRRGTEFSLSDERTQKLDEIGINWGFRSNKRDWNDWIYELLEFKAEHGHCNVPVKYEKNPSLSMWVWRQRQRYENFGENKSSPLTCRQMEHLRAIGFDFTKSAYNKTLWRDRLNDLRKFKAMYGHCEVTGKYGDKFGALYNWVRTQRRQLALLHANKHSTLTSERIKDLEEVGLFGSLIWRKRMKELRHFKKVYGHCYVPPNYSTYPCLYDWLMTQRRQFILTHESKRSDVEKGRINSLKEIGFDFAPAAAR